MESSLVEFHDPAREWRRVFAEAWGTFLLVSAAAGGGIAGAQFGEVTAAMKAVAPALTVMTMIYGVGAVSGAHLNPAVTFGFAVRGNFPWRRVPGYVLAQLAGSVLAILVLRKILGDGGDLGATLPAAGVSALRAAGCEALLTAGLVSVILSTSSGPRNVGPNAGIAVGGFIAAAGLWAVPVTGASMNPARSLGPDLVRGDLRTSWIYLIGPLAGAMLAVAFEWILKGPPTAHGAQAAQGDGS